MRRHGGFDRAASWCRGRIRPEALGATRGPHLLRPHGAEGAEKWAPSVVTILAPSVFQNLARARRETAPKLSPDFGLENGAAFRHSYNFRQGAEKQRSFSAQVTASFLPRTVSPARGFGGGAGRWRGHWGPAAVTARVGREGGGGGGGVCGF